MKRTQPISALSRLTVVCSVVCLSACGTSQLLNVNELRRLVGMGTDPAASQPAATEPEDAPSREPDAPPAEDPAQLYAWQGEGRPVTHAVIDLNAQRAHFYAGDEQIGWARVATGVQAFPTPTGQFAVLEKVAEKRSNLYGKIYDKAGKLVKSNAQLGRDKIPQGGRFVGAEMPYFLRLTNDGIGLHAGRIPMPVRPASHGCIRLPKPFAPLLYAHVSHGTPMTIVGSGPSYEEYLQRQGRRAAHARLEREAARQRAKVAQEAARTAPSSGPPSGQPTARPGTSDRLAAAAAPLPSTGAEMAASAGAAGSVSAPVPPISEPLVDRPPAASHWAAGTAGAQPPAAAAQRTATAVTAGEQLVSTEPVEPGPLVDQQPSSPPPEALRASPVEVGPPVGEAATVALQPDLAVSMPMTDGAEGQRQEDPPPVSQAQDQAISPPTE